MVSGGKVCIRVQGFEDKLNIYDFNLPVRSTMKVNGTEFFIYNRTLVVAYGQLWELDFATRNATWKLHLDSNRHNTNTEVFLPVDYDEIIPQIRDVLIYIGLIKDLANIIINYLYTNEN
jgi:hypothetical protein